MNKVYHLVKNRSTGVLQVVSELASGAKKGKTAKIAALSLVALLSTNVLAATGIPQGVTAQNSVGGAQKVNVSGSGQVIDLGIGNGFADTEKGDDIKKHKVEMNISFTDLYKEKYQDVKDATQALNTATQEKNTAKNAWDTAIANNESQAILDALEQEYNTSEQTYNTLKQTYDDAKTASDNITQFKVDDPNNLMGENSEGTTISKKEITYKDPATGKSFKIEVFDKLETVKASSSFPNSPTFEFHEKNMNQHENMELVEVTGSGTDVTIINNGDNADKAKLNAISKKGSGAILVKDGANITYDTNTSYYTGNTDNISKPYEELVKFDENNNHIIKSTVTLNEVSFKGVVNTVLGQRDIKNEDDFNAFNKELIEYIRKTEQLALDYPSAEEMKAFYDQQIAAVYVEGKVKGSYTIEYTITKDEFETLAKNQYGEQVFNNKVTNADKGTDRGLMETKDNYFIGVDGSDSTITISEKANITNSLDSKKISDGTVIKADFTNSGSTANNKFKIDGTINANGGDAIVAKNANVNVSATGNISGDITVSGQGANGVENTVENKGKIQGTVNITEKGKVTNHANAELGSVISVDKNYNKGTVNVINDGTIHNSVNIGNNSTVDNQNGGLIGGNVITGKDSTVKNAVDSKIDGTVVISGANGTLENKGYVGGVNASDEANVTNDKSIVGNNSVINLSDKGKLTNKGDIFIGYTKDDKSPASVAAANDKTVTVAINVTGTGSELVNQKDIHVSSSQRDLNVISVSNSGKYVQDSSATLTLNADDSAISSSNVNAETGNNNKAVLVNNATAEIKGTITLQDSGSTALYAVNGGNITLDGTGTINLDSKNIDANTQNETDIRSFGAWIEGNGSKLVMQDNSVINMNADSTIGVHIRNGASAELTDQSGIVFNEDKKNQIGFLISGIQNPSSIVYDTKKELKLQGNGSVLFRVERGSTFNINTINATDHDFYKLNSNNAENSTLLVITNGAVATGSGSNQTHADLDGFSLEVSGKNAKGISVEGGATAKISDKTGITLAGNESILASVDGNYYDLNGDVQNTKPSENSSGNLGKNPSTLTSAAILSTDTTDDANKNVTATKSTGYYLTHSGILNHQGKIDFSNKNAEDNIGVKIDTGGTLNSEKGSSIKVNGTAVEISGAASQAVINNVDNDGAPVIWAIGEEGHTNDSAYHVLGKANLTLTGGGITKAEGTAHGILVDDAGKIVLEKGAFVDLYGNGVKSSTGNGIENRYELKNIVFDDARIDVRDGIGIHSGVGFEQTAKTSGVINVRGEGTGISFEGIDRDTGEVTGATSHSINNTGYENVVVNVYGSDGKGIYVNSDSADKTVNTSASVNILKDDGKSALIIEGTTEKVSQSGKLHSASTQDTAANPIVSMNHDNIKEVTNNGEILFGTAQKDPNNNNEILPEIDRAKNSETNNLYAINLNDGGKVTFTNNGKMNGIVQLLGQTGTTGNTVNLADGSEGNRFVSGSGNDVYNVGKVTGIDTADDGVKFTSINSGGGNADIIHFTAGTSYEVTKADTLVGLNTVSIEGANSHITLTNIGTEDGLTTDTDKYFIEKDTSSLAYIWNGGNNTSFNRLITGEGTFKVDFQNLDSKGKPTGEFAFDNTTNTGQTGPDEFSGTLDLNNVNYTLANSTDNLNTDALKNATLKASGGSYVTVDDKQTIKGLNFSGGTVNFGAVDIAQAVSDNHITVDTLTLVNGNIEIDASGSIYNINIPTSLPLLEQDNAIRFTQLVQTSHIVGSAAGVNADLDRDVIQLFDQEGNKIEEPTTKASIVQNNEEVARATYGVRLTKYKDYHTAKSQDDGLYLGYGLTQVELKVKNAANGIGNALILDASASTNPSDPSTAELDATITDYDNGDGTCTYGDLQIRGTENVTLSAENSYHGSTYIKDTASLTSGFDNALGTTRLLQLDSNTKFDLNNNTQSIGSLITSAYSKVDLNGGTLTITGIDGTGYSNNLVSHIQGNTLFGSGTLIFGDVTANPLARSLPPATPVAHIYGDNLNYTGDIINAPNNTIYQYTAGGLGVGTFTNNGTYNLYLTEADTTLSNPIINGGGVINKYNTGIVELDLGQSGSYDGQININEGAIRFVGTGSAPEDTDPDTAKYQAYEVNINKNGSLIGTNYTQFAYDVTNAGRFYVGNEKDTAKPTKQEDYKTVKIDGNYKGNGGTLIFNGVLGDDNSWFNKLIIGKDVQEGTSYVQVNNIGGLGAKTEVGILLIDVAGTNNGTFTKTGRIMAGAYDYSVMTGKQIDKKLNLLEGVESPRNSESVYLWSEEGLRPEYGGYITNIFVANNMFNLRLHDRLGETQYTDVFTGEQKVTSMWIRNHYSYSNLRAGGNELKMTNRTNVTQIGGDIAQWSSDDLNRFHLGVMVGYGNSRNKSKSTLTGRKADSKVDGYSYGVYGTWYDNDQDKTGFYVDTWALWSNLNASVSGEDFSEKYRLKGLTTSIESGYSFLADKWGDYDVWLQPKGQLIWGGVKAKDFTEKESKARIAGNDGSLQTRLGLRASFLRNPIVEDETGESSNHQFFTEVNWLHNSKMYKIKADDLNVEQNGARNIGELKLGVEGNVKNNTNLWLNIAGQHGNDHYKNYSAQVGVKYSF